MELGDLVTRVVITERYKERRVLAFTSRRIESIGPLFLEPSVPGVNDELAGVVSSGFFDACSDRFALELKRGVAFLALSLESPFFTGGDDMIADPFGFS